MVDVLHCQVALIFAMLDRPAVLCLAIRHGAQERGHLFFEERLRSIVEHLSGHQRVLPIIEFGESDACIAVDEGLLIDEPDPYERIKAKKAAP